MSDLDKLISNFKIHIANIDRHTPKETFEEIIGCLEEVSKEIKLLKENKNG